MIELDLNDPTQKEIKRHIIVTEKLLSSVATELSKTKKCANILLMPDLGLPRSIKRAHGGFFNGAIYVWDTSIPFVPVDATVNCCGTSMFRLKYPISSKQEFYKKIFSAKEKICRTSYVWNFNVGNHFIAYGEIIGGKDVLKDGAYVVLHSSAAEFKYQYNGLYPEKDNWYFSKIKILRDYSTNRYIRYIKGETAEKFFRIAKMLENYNKIRHQILAGFIFGEDEIEEEILNIQHYGMPTQNSIAIGCYWLSEEGIYLFLTNQHNYLYCIKALRGGDNTVTLGEQSYIIVPHGLGNIFAGIPQLDYKADGLYIGERYFSINQKLKFNKDIMLRDYRYLSLDNMTSLLSHILKICPGIIVGYLRQMYNYNFFSDKYH